jgi:hypothetical protein
MQFLYNPQDSQERFFPVDFGSILGGFVRRNPDIDLIFL